MKKNNQKGFTLIELLVVIAIIGLLSTLAVVSLNNARAKARDARRLSDVKQIQTALELYFTDRSQYPPTILFDGSGRIATGTPSVTYMGSVPQNPTPWGDGLCTGAEYTYQACNVDGTVCGASTDFGSYVMTYCIGQETGSVSGGDLHHATPAGIVDDE